MQGLSTLRGYWVYAKINKRLWLMSHLMWSYIPMDWVTIEGIWWKWVFSIEVPWYLMILRQSIPLGDPKDIWSMTITFHLVKFDICSLEVEYVNWLHNKWIYNSRIGDVILIDDYTTLLDWDTNSWGICKWWIV